MTLYGFGYRLFDGDTGGAEDGIDRVHPVIRNIGMHRANIHLYFLENFIL